MLFELASPDEREIMEKLFNIVIGDYSDDGHGKSQTVTLKLTADDLSDEALKEAFQKTNEEVGINLYDLCTEYEDVSISEDLYKRLKELGFTFSDDEYFHPIISVDDALELMEDENEPGGFREVEVYFSAAELAGWWVAHNLKNGSYEIVENKLPTLIGGWSPVLESPPLRTFYGYGLFT